MRNITGAHQGPREQFGTVSSPLIPKLDLRPPGSAEKAPYRNRNQPRSPPWPKIHPGQIYQKVPRVTICSTRDLTGSRGLWKRTRRVTTLPSSAATPTKGHGALTAHVTPAWRISRTTFLANRARVGTALLTPRRLRPRPRPRLRCTRGTRRSQIWIGTTLSPPKLLGVKVVQPLRTVRA